MAGTLALLVAILLSALPPGRAAEIANRLAGERWYAMTLRHRPIGHYRAHTARTDEGHYAFRTELAFRLDGGSETRMTDALLFGGRPPHQLRRAEHALYTGEALQTQVVIADRAATVVRGGDRRRVDADVRLRMGDYLAIERWLAEDEPAVGDVHLARSIDFDRLAVATDRWRVLARDADGIEVGKESEPDSTYVRMDKALVPQRMHIGPLFTLRSVADERVARLWESRPRLFDDAEDIPVDRRIERPEALTRLAVAIQPAGDSTPSWMDALPATLTADRHAQRTADPADLARLAEATVRYPADDAPLVELAERAVAGLAGGRERATALTGFVHDYLQYRDIDHPRSVLETMRSRVGDCTEFADFYTTLARAVGLRARTVVGIAYRASPGTFGLHAWNEVAVDGAWHSVDPTWGQDPADLTHLRLPEASALTFIAERENLRLEVVEAVY